MKIVLVAVARPNFVKIAPILRAMARNKNLEAVLVHTGQHYYYEMSQAFFDDLDIPNPDYFLNAGSGSHAKQTARVMVKFEKICIAEHPDMVVVVGDVNSTVACSVTAKKLNVKVAHVEAGLRSGDMTMSEEINRIVTDSISDYLFVTEKSRIENLKREGQDGNSVFFVGNVMIDTLYYQLDKLNRSAVFPVPGIKEMKNVPYAVVTLHRPSNVDDEKILRGIIDVLIRISEDISVIFPVHPQTKKKLEMFDLIELINGSGIRMLPPLPYMPFLKLWKDSSLVLTDSGGLQEETTALGVPCFTIRENTERPVIIDDGTNVLVGTTKQSILSEYEAFNGGVSKKGRIPELWDGKAAERTFQISRSLIKTGRDVYLPS